MLTKDYFTYAIKQDLLLSRSWILSSFMLPVENQKVEADHPLFKDGKCYVTINGEEQEIEDFVQDLPLLKADAVYTLEPNLIDNANEKIKTCYGNVMFNFLCLAYPFGNRVTYINDRVNGKKLDNIIANGLKSGLIKPSEFTGKFMPAMGFITVFTQVLVPAATEKYIFITEKLKETRDILIKKHGKDLHRPEVAAIVDGELTKVLKEHLKGDDAERHALKAKVYGTVLKKQYGSMGGVAKLDNPSEVQYMGASLMEGWDANNKEEFAAMVNGLRSGSFDRGAETALGGAAAKTLSRMFQNSKLSEHDCNSKFGMRLKVMEIDYKEYVGRYLVSDPKTPLTEAKLKASIGKFITIRDPQACKSKNGNLCGVCLGNTVESSGIGLTSQASAVGSTFLSISLAKFHAKELVLQEYDFTERLM